MDKCLDELNPSGASITRHRNAVCIQDVLDELQSDNDDEIVAVVAIPPETFDGITDEEDINDELLEVDESLENDMAGTFEFETSRDREGVSDLVDDAPVIKSKARKSARITIPMPNNTRGDDEQPTTSSKPGRAQKRKLPSSSFKVREKRSTPNIQESNNNEDEDREPSTAETAPTYKLPSAFSSAQWKKVTESAVLPFENVNIPEPLEQLQVAIQHKFGDVLPSDIFFYFFDDEVCELIVSETKRYAIQKNDVHFAQIFNSVLLKRFIGILVLSGHNKLPQIGCYWSTNPTLGSTIVQQTMPRSMFRKIKQYLHFQDNNDLDINDKYTKVRAIFDLINKKFMQFGVFEEHLSIDEQMLPYFGRHSCKMYIKSKPIKFGYKTWCMASTTGYVFRMLPYGGATDKYDKNIGLGASVVITMVNQLEFPSRHQLYFDNFFTSYYLMCLLADKCVCATGTVRSNRLGHPTPELRTGKALAKGEFDAKFDKINTIVCCRWQDKREVTLLSNFTGVYSLTSTTRRQRQKEGQPSQIIVQQPNIIRNYNSFMGGVDLHDNAVSNYRVSIRSKKWWWPLWLAVLESSVVNSCKLQCLVNKKLALPKASQLTFRVELATNLLLTPDEIEGDATSSESEEDDTTVDKTFEIRPLPRVSGHHKLIVQPQKKARRCKVCHKPTQRMCSKWQVHLHLDTCFARFHKWEQE